MLTIEHVRDALTKTRDYINPFVVGFVWLERPRPDDAAVGGSGTLVKLGDTFAILTAAHVLDALPANGELGLAFPSGSSPKLHRYTLEASHLTYLRVAPASHTASGPDLGVIVLPGSEGRKLEVNKTFYNLSKRQDAMLSSPRSITDGGWFISGMVHEQTADLEPERGFSAVKAFHGICGAGCVDGERQDENYDYLEFQTKFGPSYEGPQNYQGMSGGGLWQVVFEKQDDEISVRDALLSGVVFYQNEVSDGITLTCHGRRSIYWNVCNALK